MGAEGQERALLGAAIVAAVAGLVLRAVGIFNAFWLDEIWTLDFVRELASPLAVFTGLHHDNNHLLNSLWVYLLGDRAPWPLYRGPAFVSSLVALWLAFRLGARSGRSLAFVYLILFGGSYLMVLYGSEARGYATLVLCCLWSQLCLPGALSGERRALWLYVAGALLGAMAHLIYLHYFFAALLYSWARVESLGRGAALRRLVAVHGIPLFFFALLYLVHVRHLPPSAGPVRPWGQVIASALSIASGGPELFSGEPLRLLLVCLFASAGVALFFLGLASVVRRGAGEKKAYVFYVAAIVLAPMATLVVLRPATIFVRYFLVAIVCLYLLWGEALADWWDRGGRTRALAMTLLLLFLCGNGLYGLRFVQNGRGDYYGALGQVVEETSGASIDSSGDNLFRNGTMIDFYGRFFPDKRFAHRRFAGYGAGPEWWFAHSFDRRSVAPEEKEILGVRYEHRGSFPHTALSGFTWHLYRRVDTDGGLRHRRLDRPEDLGLIEVAAAHGVAQVGVGK